MELNKMDDLYDILDVDFGCNDDEINSQYKKKIKKFTRILSRNNQLTPEDKIIIKNIKVAKYVLSNPNLRKKYDLLKIIEDSDDSKSKSIDYSKPKFNGIESYDIPLRKDKSLDYDFLSNRQFERYEHKDFDLSKDRQLRGAKFEKKDR